MKTFVVLAALLALGACASVRLNAEPAAPKKTFTPKRVSVRADCGGFIDGVSSGNMSSPNYPSNYNNNDACDWFVTVEEGSIIRINIVDLQTEDFYDAVTIRDGFSANSPLILSASGAASDVVVESTGNRVYVGFYADFSNNDRGFFATWEAVPAA